MSLARERRVEVRLGGSCTGRRNLGRRIEWVHGGYLVLLFVDPSDDKRSYLSPEVLS